MARDDDKFFISDTGYGHIRFDTAAGVEHLSIDRLADGHIHLGRTDIIKGGGGILALDQDLGIHGLVEEDNIILRGLAFGLQLVKPVIMADGWRGGPCVISRAIEHRYFPANTFSKAGALSFQAFMQRHTPNTAGCFNLMAGPMQAVMEAHGFGHAFLIIGAVHLKRHSAGCQQRPHTAAGHAVYHPFRHGQADTAGV